MLHDANFNVVKGMRPFSLVAAVVGCGLGILLGLKDALPSWDLVVATMTAGLLLQVGTNLIIDKSELSLLTGGDPGVAAARGQVRLNYQLGLFAFALAIGSGCYLIAQHGWPVFAVGLVGVVGAFTYTMEPVNYKRRGLGVVVVFFLMGVLMVQGAYLAVTGSFSATVLLHSLPISCWASLLLLSNELRDWDVDRHHGLRTLAVRIGYPNGVRLYWILLAASYVLSLSLSGFGYLAQPWWLLLPLPLLWPMPRLLRSEQRTSLPPNTGRLYLLFAMGYILALG